MIYFDAVALISNRKVTTFQKKFFFNFFITFAV